MRRGKFELAEGGTIFLDEIGDMSLSAQAKVLRVLEEGKVERVGGSRLIPVDVRVIAATNKNLQEAIRQGHFREDLYHRLNVIPIHVAPLRERREDVPVLVRAFADDICRRYGMPVKAFGDAIMTLLQGMEWGGNVRELRNMVERLIIMSGKGGIDASALDRQAAAPAGEIQGLLTTGGTFQDFKDRSEAAYIRHQLELHGWNVSKAAEAMDIQRSHLYNKIRKYGLMRGEE
jgi:DNA-binding NtrC family response regulator